MLEKMAEFFEARLAGYDAHMLANIAGAREFYPYTASLLPKAPGSRLLDLGCGTGLELEAYFDLCPTARVTGVDLSRGMLNALKEKFPEKELDLRCGSYFDLPFGTACFDAAVSVESLHHFTQGEKVPLYRKLRDALVPGGCFILTDYFALTEEEEQSCRREALRLRREQGIPDGEFYHYDTPLTVEHERNALLCAGFSRVEILKNWTATYTLAAIKK